MAKKFLDDTGLKHLVDKITSALKGKVDKETGKGLSTNDFTDILKAKLDGMNENANQTKIKVGDNTMGTAKGDDTFTIVGSGDTSVTANPSTKTITISSTNPTVPEYTITKQTTADTGFIATYQLFKGSTAVGDKINIPKDYLVKSAELKTCTQANVPVQGYKVGDKYIDFVINTKDSSVTDEHLYILVSDLVDTYTGGKGITITSNKIAVALTTNGGLKFSADSDSATLEIDNAVTPDTTGLFKKLKYNGKGLVTGTADVTATDIAGAGGVTSITAGSGLTGGGSPTSGAVTISANIKTGNGLSIPSTGTDAGKIVMGVGTNSTTGAVKVKNGNGLAIDNSTGEISMGIASDSAAGAMSAADYSKLYLLQALPTTIGTYTYNVTTAGQAGAYTAMEFLTTTDIDNMWAGKYPPAS